ncbi:hypothetical protein HDV04_004923 [Boothiomyces sp. JEL0838]|nr:hypothetical protein HDV04_004908 [Boothiomyces sp. JEL0838]KAJ3310595.1 hypothetical protein HDV04_004923 [Boothiomyces sp. JEL0838]
MSIYDENIVNNVLYNFASNDYILPVCGSNPIKIYSGCCGSSLDLSSSLGYQSWSESPIDTADLAHAPRSAISKSYCALYPFEPNSLQNYTTIMALADGSCTINGIRCFSNQTISIYDNYNCTGKVSHSILQSPQILETTVYGKVTGKMLSIWNGSVVYTWVAYSPEVIEVPSEYSHLIPIEYLAFSSIGLAAILSLVKTGYIATSYIQSKRKLALYQSFNSALWFIWIVLCYFYYITIFTTNDGWMILSQFQNFVFNLATYMTSAGTLMFFLEIKRKPEYYKYGLGCLLLYQIIFAGSNYIAFFKFYPSTTVYVSYWAYLNPVWIVSVYLFDTMPQIILVCDLIHHEQLKKKTNSFGVECRMFLREHKVYLSLVVMHICNMISFFIILYVTSYSDILGNDRAALAMCGPVTLVDALHSILNTSILAELKLILASKINKTKVPSIVDRVKGRARASTIQRKPSAMENKS